MSGLQPYKPLSSDREEIKYTFRNMEDLVAHFSRWLPPNLIHNLVETEKSVFVVRKECSLEETRLQFLKKCELSLTRVMTAPDPGSATGEWYAV